MDLLLRIAQKGTIQNHKPQLQWTLSHIRTDVKHTFNGLMREQNIYGNHQASSRDIATRVALMDHVRYLCDEGHSENKVMYVINHNYYYNAVLGET